MVEIVLLETKKLVVHDVLEYNFEDLMLEFVADEEAGEELEKVRQLRWADGVAMWIERIPPSAVLDDFLRGIVHYERVTYALMEEFQKRVIRGNVTINLIDDSEEPVHNDLAQELKKHSKYYEYLSGLKSGDQDEIVVNDEKRIQIR